MFCCSDGRSFGTGEEGDALEVVGAAVADYGAEEEYECLSGGGSDVFLPAVEAFGSRGVAFVVAEYVVSRHEQCGKFRLYLWIVEFDRLHAAAEDCQLVDRFVGQRLILAVAAECRKEFGNESVDLVVAAFRFFGKFEHAHVFGFYVVDYGAEILGDGKDDVAGCAFGFGHVVADESRECSLHDFNFIAKFEVYVVYRKEWEFVSVSDRYPAECIHFCVAHYGVSAFGTVVENE